jgi:formate/nitrite transporter FocA (FNT family)
MGLVIGARTTSGKILTVLLTVSAFVAAGCEHSVANMYLIPLGLFIKTWGLAILPSGLSATIPDLGSLTWANFTWSLPITMGNLIGGAGLVGAVYRLVYLRSQRRA